MLRLPVDYCVISMINFQLSSYSIHQQHWTLPSCDFRTLFSLDFFPKSFSVFLLCFVLFCQILLILCTLCGAQIWDVFSSQVISFIHMTLNTIQNYDSHIYISSPDISDKFLTLIANCLFNITLWTSSKHFKFNMF